MINLPLARSLRPKTYKEVSGHDGVKEALKKILTPLKHHTFLFAGPRGLGKTTLSRLIAQTLLCEKKEHDGEPCGHCMICQQIQQGQYPDFIEIDGASKTKVEDVRELIQRSYARPLAGAYKIYLIDEAHMLSLHSFNALLKALEEPPEHVVYILATTELHKLPPTVRSRCLTFLLQPASVALMQEYLISYCQENNIQYDEQIIRALAQEAQGSYRDLLNILQYCLVLGEGSLISNQLKQYLCLIGDEKIESLIKSIAGSDLAAITEFFRAPQLSTLQPESFVKQIMAFLSQTDSISLPMKSFLYPQVTQIYQSSIEHPFVWDHIQLSFIKIALTLKKKTEQRVNHS